METLGEALRRRRLERSMSQRQLAERAGVPQPNVSAYENGSRTPNAETLRRLDVALTPAVQDRLSAERDRILEAAGRRGLSRVRVFGSVARGEATAASDLDLLVHPGAASTVFDLAAFRAEVETLVGVPVDVVSDRGDGPTMNRILREATPV